MTFALLLAAAGFAFVSWQPDTNAVNPSSSDSANAAIPLSERTASMVVLGSTILYVSSYALGLGNVPWQQSELFPLSVRSLGSGLATATNWGSNFCVALLFLPMMDLLSPSWTFVVYALVCAAGWVAIWMIYPETKGLSLEEVGELLRDDWGVKKSLIRASE